MNSRISIYIKFFEEELAGMSSFSKLLVTIFVIWLTFILGFSFIGIFINDVLWFMIYGMPLGLSIRCYLSLYLFELLITFVIISLLDIFLMSVIGFSIKTLQKISPVLTLMFFMTISHLIGHYRLEVFVINRMYHHSFINSVMLLILIFLMYGKLGTNYGILRINDN